jgi:hypothetical protein
MNRLTCDVALLPRLLMVATPLLLWTAGAAGQSVEYVLDSGIGNINSGPGTTPPNGQMLWGNVFTAQAGGERITAISVAFGTAVVGTPVTAVLLEDPNDDGNPADGVLLSSGHGQVASPRTNVFTRIEIPPAVVSGRFFVGIVMDYTQADRPARQSTGVANANWSWLFVAPQINFSDLAGSPIIRSQGAIPGTWMIRAVGEAPVPAGCSLADVNADGSLDGTDFILFINSFAIGDAGIDPVADVDQDGTIDGNDFVSFINAFAAGCN